MSSQASESYDSLLVAYGVTVHKVAIEPLSPGSAERGFVATENIYPGDVVVSVPRRHIITLKTVARELGFDWRS